MVSDRARLSDPAQAQAENEFLAAAIAKEHAFYAGDAERYISYYADNAISVQPGIPEIDGRAVLAEGTVPYVTDNNIVGKLNHQADLGLWRPRHPPSRVGRGGATQGGGAAEHHIGRCTLNWEKIDGQWKVVSEYINYLEPPTTVQ